MKKYGLPTFPIYDNMDVGYERNDDELYWLLSVGYFISSPIAFYQKIILEHGKEGEGECILVQGSHERHLAARGEEEIGRFPTLDKLLKSRRRENLSLARWQWHGNEEEQAHGQ